MRAPLESRHDCWKAPNSVAWSGATRLAETARRRSMSRRDAQLLRAMAASSAGPRTVLNAGHSKTAVSVYSAAYACGSRLRYARTSRAFNESMPAFAWPADGRGGCEQPRPTMKSETKIVALKVVALMDALMAR